MNPDREKYLDFIANIRKALKVSPNTPVEDIPSICEKMKKSLDKIYEKAGNGNTNTRKFETITKLSKDALEGTTGIPNLSKNTFNI